MNNFVSKMGLIQIAVLLALFAVSFENVNASRQRYYSRQFGPAPSGCATYPCGTNAKCSMTDGRPVCSCLNLHMGDPLINCHKVECVIPEDCPIHLSCGNNECVNPCDDICGVNANCEVKNHVPTCSCPSGYTGDPLKRCRVRDPDEACKPSPCGANTKCEVIGGVPTCSCLPGYRGSALYGCRHECERDSDCANNLACTPKFRCENPCQCGEGANCHVINHKPTCSCPTNWLGSPHTRCYPECITHADCPRDRIACFSHQCINPCARDTCGTNANCELDGFTPVCSCPRGMTGDPFVRCRPYEPEDLCIPNPCGEHAVCTPGHDRDGNERAVCSCGPGFFGDALVKCQRGECETDSDCRDHLACINNYCLNPCTGRECAATAKCEGRRHIAICSCLDGTRGDAVTGCSTIRSNVKGFNTYFRRG